MHRTFAAGVTTGVAAAALLAASPASAATVIAGYQMNETRGTQMTSSTGNHHGTIGSDVVLTGSVYRFPKPPTSVRREHLVTVKNATALNPGTRTWSLTTRVRYTQASGNIVQKGQSTGQFFKLESHRGALSCLFRGSGGSKAAGTGGTGIIVNDGRWHTVTCRRSGSEVSITVDGRKRTATGATGAISNTYPLSIGGKTSCNGTTVGCDYWVGDMDYLRIETG